MAEERQAYNEISPWWGEHIHRYREAINRLPKNARVLDLACGNGYGTFLISDYTSEMVIGGDLDKTAIRNCKKLFQKSNLVYKQIDATNIPYEDQSFDCVISFETIEHTKEYKKVLTEFNRILKPGGKLFLSTPNIKINSPEGIIRNKYHTQEFNYSQLKEIIGCLNFKNIAFYGQRFIRFDKSSIINKAAKVTEKALYLRGIRKLPISFRNKITQILIKKPHYPTVEDYKLTDTEEEIKRCKTFFVICEK